VTDSYLTLTILRNVEPPIDHEVAAKTLSAFIAEEFVESPLAKGANEAMHGLQTLLKDKRHLTRLEKLNNKISSLGGLACDTPSPACTEQYRQLVALLDKEISDTNKAIAIKATKESDVLTTDELKAVLVKVNALKYFTPDITLDTFNSGTLYKYILNKSAVTVGTDQ